MSFVQNEKNGLVYMTSSVIKCRHCFTTRYGGVSEGSLSSLNLGENRGDTPENVRENYRLLQEATGINTQRIAFTKQVHENHVQVVTAADTRALFEPSKYTADGVVTA
ncbi:MAG: laccase domain-containing protein, partial [Oscillospiraceae bacterium]|nr:laccase domain-containing protein [Oscillospiraceae bacterium]